MRAKNGPATARAPLNILLQLDHAYDFSNRITAGVGRYLAENPGWRVHIRTVTPDWTPSPEDPVHWDGMITHILSREHAERINQSGIAAVNVSGRADTTGLLPSILTDFGRAAEMAVAFLVERGYRSFATWMPAGRSSHTGITYDRFEHVLESQGHPCRRLDRELPDWPMRTSRHQIPTADEINATRAILTSLAPQTAILVAIDPWAQSILDAAEAEGLAIPEDLAVIGIGDDRHFTELAHPQVTSVNMDFQKRGFIAIETLRHLIEGQKHSLDTHWLEPRGVIERASTRLLPSDDPEVLKAMRFIRENASEPIGVEDVMDAVTCSRRTLEHRFEQELGSSIHDEIWKAHVEFARRMLAETDVQLVDVAIRSGFASRSTFSNVFKSRTGLTPSQYRRQYRTRA